MRNPAPFEGPLFAGRAEPTRYPASASSRFPLAREALGLQQCAGDLDGSRGRAFNATIGQITDGRGRAVPLSPLADALAGLGDELCNRALLYSPVEGLADLRRLWRERRPLPPRVPAALPIITAGPVQALSLLADLFLRPGRTVILAEGWPDGGEIFTPHTGARAVSADGPDDLTGALVRLPWEEPAFVALRSGEPARSAPLLAAAERHLLVVASEETETEKSLYSSLAGRHPRILAFQVESAAAVGFAGAGLGFLTLPFDPGTDAARFLEDKVKLLPRAVAGSPPATGGAAADPGEHDLNKRRATRETSPRADARYAAAPRRLIGPGSARDRSTGQLS